MVTTETSSGGVHVAQTQPAESSAPERLDVVVIGGGQAGLAMGYHLARRGLRFVILEANEVVGASWRLRWDSLRLFTPAAVDGLPGMRFPAGRFTYPTKDQMADYLEQYAATSQLPVRTSVTVDALRHDEDGQGYVVTAGLRRWLAQQVVLATGSYAEPKVPAFAGELDPGILQLHSSEYRNPAQLRPGGVLVVGASNSGAEIACDVARDHPTWLSGRDPGHIPIDNDGLAIRLFGPLFWVLQTYVLTIRTPFGRKARPIIRGRGGPLIRAKPAQLAAAGVERLLARTVGVRDGRPLLEDGQVLDVANVIWATGFQHALPWIDLPIERDGDWPREVRGVIPSAPGLYVVGLPFQYAGSSSLVGGVGRDAAYLAGVIAARARLGVPA